MKPPNKPYLLTCESTRQFIIYAENGRIASRYLRHMMPTEKAVSCINFTNDAQPLPLDRRRASGG